MLHAHRAQTTAPAGPKYCPNELGIDSWRFRLKNSRFGRWNGHRLGDIPKSELLRLWKEESARQPVGYYADQLMGEVVRRGLIGTPNRKRRRKRRHNGRRQSGDQP